MKEPLPGNTPFQLGSEVQCSVYKPGGFPDLPIRVPSSLLRGIPDRIGYAVIIAQGKPPIGVDYEWCSPFVVSFLQPYGIVEPIVRGAFI